MVELCRLTSFDLHCCVVRTVILFPAIIYIYIYCGIFTPCKNGNLATRSRNYARVDAVFSLCQAELCRVMPSRTLPRLVRC
jgi:hypothetical protein